MITIAFDSETNGLDSYHAARPFFVTMCIDDDSKQDWAVKFWEWDVDPLTRKPKIRTDDLFEIRELLDSADKLVAHNIKFDVTVLESIGVYAGREDIKLSSLPGEDGIEFPWEKCEDTLVASHMLYTARKHDLTSLVSQYLNNDPEHPADIEPYEKTIHRFVEACRRETRKQSFKEVHGQWMISTKDMPGFPSSKGVKRLWHADMWLPLALAKAYEYPPDHPFYTCLEEYANADSEHTLALWYEIWDVIKRRRLEKIYRCRMDVIPIGQRMERDSVTGSVQRARRKARTYKTNRLTHVRICTQIADEHNVRLVLPNSGTTKELSNFVFKTLGCTPTKRGKTGQASLDKEVLEHLVITAKPGVQEDFLKALQNKRKCDTAVQYLRGYERFWLSSVHSHEDGDDTIWFRMHPFLNSCGTVQLRWSSSNPNEQNISKQEGYNLREAFGPLPGREWWSLDYQNLELRIPTFEAKELALMDVFLKPKDPPYYGSYHLVVFDALHPEKFKQYGKDCKDVFEATWYQWVKNGNFAMIYGCGRNKANATYKVANAYDIVRERFPNIAKLSDKMISDGKKYGYIQTIPDRTIDPARGFPIMVSRTSNGDVLPTTPLNYHVSGTACWCTAKAMIRCDKTLRSWKDQDVWRNIYNVSKILPAHTKLQVHDELVFDFPLSKSDPKIDLQKEKDNKGVLTYKHNPNLIDLKQYGSNLGFVRLLQREMEKSGDDIGMPLPVGVEYNREDWGTITLKC